MNSEFERIQSSDSHDGSVFHIQLNAPKANVLDSKMMNEIKAALEDAGSRQECKLVVFEAAGPHFSFGASVEEHRKEKVAGMLRNFHDLFLKLIDLSLPTLAVVRGQCLGGGLELASFCDFVFADTSAVFAAPEIKLAVFPPIACLVLPRKIGQGHADRMILTGCNVTAQEAERMGLVHTVARPETLDDEINQFIEEYILPKSASSLRHAAQASRWEFNEELREHCKELEDFYLNSLMSTEDANEGIQAFLEKRPAEWKNR